MASATPRPGRPTVLVLGATGFLGQALVRRLLQDGHRLRALVRGPSERAAGLARCGVDVVSGDFVDTATVAAALDGIQHVYHLARGAGPTWDDYQRHDVEPTRRLAELCCARRIRLHYTSSIAIYDGGRAGDVIDESTPPCPAATRLNVYARAKLANETLLADMHRSRGLDMVVYRPGIVIGGGGSPRPAGVGDWPDPSTCRPWGAGRFHLPFVLVDDCADAMARGLAVADIAGESFNLIGGAGLTGEEYLRALEHAAGIRIQRRALPTWRLFAQSVVKWALKTVRGAPERPLPSYRYCAGLTRRARFSSDAARQRLGWTPVSDPRELIARGIQASVDPPAR